MRGIQREKSGMTPEAQAAIREDWRKDLPAILAGRDPHVDIVDPAWCSKIACVQIVIAVSKASGLSMAAINSRRRGHLYGCVRRVIYKLIHEMRADMTITQIGKFMDRDRTAAAHGIETATAMLNTDGLTRKIYRDAKRELRQ